MTAHPIDTEALRERALGQLGKPHMDPRWPGLVLALLDIVADTKARAEAAEHRATQAESERDEWKEVALQERGAALDLLEQIKNRDARIKAVQDVLDKVEAGESWFRPVDFSGTPFPITVDTADLRHALDGDI